MQKNQVFSQFALFLQKKYSVQVLYLCQTGSRLHRTSTYQSDHDVKGITKSSKQTVIRSTALSFKGIKNKIDIELIPFQIFIAEISKGESPMLRWVNSDIVYVDKIDNFRQIIIHGTDFPVGETSQRVEKDLLKSKRNGLRKAKKLLNMIIDTLLIYYAKTQGQFPPMQVNQLVQYVRPFQFVYIQALQSKVQEIIQMKQTGRAFEQIEVGEWLITFSQRALAMPPRQSKSKKLRDECIQKLAKVVGKVFS